MTYTIRKACPNCSYEVDVPVYGTDCPNEVQCPDCLGTVGVEL